MAEGVSGVGLAAIAAGSLFMWAGIKGTGITQTLQGLIQGKDPSTMPQVNPITMPEGGSGLPGSGSGLADIMIAHLDHEYRFGGAPGPDGSNPWDCSSAINWCATKNGMAIPGSKHWNMQGHGPSTLIWLAWAPANLKRVPRNQVQRDDLVIWPTHMGVATDQADYVSAASHGAKAGGHTDTIISPIHGGGPTGELATFWRYPSDAGAGEFGGGNLPFSHDALVKLWVRAGGSQSTANNAACHAIQESSGNPSALNVGGPGPGCTAVGLWQLATPCGVGAGHTIEALKDPLLNAKLTVKATRNGRNWSNWATPGC
jgi:hypothetical protein